MNIEKLRRINLTNITKTRFNNKFNQMCDAIEKAQPYMHTVVKTSSRPFSEKLARHIEDKLDLPYGYLDKDHSQISQLIQPKMTLVKQIKIKACPSNGHLILSEEEIEPISIPTKVMTQKGLTSENVFVVEVDGLSMMPTYQPEDYIFIDKTRTTVKNYEPYLLTYDDKLMIKRIEQFGGVTTLRSDNEDKKRFPDIVVRDNLHFEIHGHIFYKMGFCS